MKNRFTLTSALLLVLLCLSPQLQAQDDVMIPMRNGVRLATDIYRPKGDGTYPIIFSRIPYKVDSWGDGEQRLNSYQAAFDAVKRGYAYVDRIRTEVSSSNFDRFDRNTRRRFGYHS